MLICTHPPPSQIPLRGLTWLGMGMGFLIPRCGGFQVPSLPQPAFSGGLRCFSVAGQSVTVT